MSNRIRNGLKLQQGRFSLDMRKNSFMARGITTVLSVSLQCLIKLWRRLFWELLKDPRKKMQSLVIASMALQGEGPA